MAELKKRCLLLCSMPLSEALVREVRALQVDVTICLDAGYLTALHNGIPFDFLMGDFDSPGIKIEELPKEALRFPAEKDYTDSMLGVMEGLRLGCEEFFIYGALGGRLDHTFHNLQLLLYLLEHGGRGTLVDEHTRVFTMQNESRLIPKQEGVHLSVFAALRDAAGVTERGVKYPLCDALLRATVPIGISNEIVEDAAFVEVKDGTLFVMLTED